MAYKCTEENFLKDVAQHQMIVLRDDGAYRHIRFKAPRTGEQYFDLITWPHYLCYTGDMGTYVFTRIEDMFEFFRGKVNDGALRINLGYWAEKCVSVDRDGITEYSPEEFIQSITENIPTDATDDLRQAIKEEVLDCADHGEHEAIEAAHSFEHGQFRFDDLCEMNFESYTGRFVWCCYALAWGIRTYDAMPSPAPKPVPPLLRDVHEAEPEHAQLLPTADSE